MKASSLAYLTPNEQAAVTEYVAGIRDHFPDRILSVILFGSKARGDGDAESDVDLLVLVDAEDGEFRSELWRIASDVSLKYNVVISVRVFAQTRWSETKRLRPPLYRAIMADGVPLTHERAAASPTG
jgi:predicted nucleotidyltransferase